MLTKLTSEKQMKFLCFLCCLVYFMSYMTRLNYAACMVELQDVLQIGKSVAGLPVTVCFLSYGLGQIICGILGDKFKPQMIMFAGLAGACGCNLLVAGFPRMEIIIPVWCANGFFQAMLWPPMVRIMAECLSDKWYKYSCVLVSMSSSVATIAVYVLTPVCISVSGWKSVFRLPAVLGIGAAFVWFWNTRKLGADSPAPEERQKGARQKEAQQDEASEKDGRRSGKKSLFLQLVGDAPLVAILLAIILQGTLRDGITTWMPVYMSEMFGMSNASSILSAAALPVFSVFSVLLASLLLERLKNEVFTAACLFVAGAAAGVVMLMVFDGLPVVCIMMMTLITGCAHGINLMLISRVPGHFTRYGKVSSVSGILNSATYVGSSLSTYGFGAVAEEAGWLPVVALWIGICLAGAALTLLVRGRWDRFCRMPEK
nr:MFS transporter [uncultured Acetatifactor sp.]